MSNYTEELIKIDADLANILVILEQINLQGGCTATTSVETQSDSNRHSPEPPSSVNGEDSDSSSSREFPTGDQWVEHHQPTEHTSIDEYPDPATDELVVNFDLASTNGNLFF